MNSIHSSLISKELSLPEKAIRQTIELLDGGATIPFIARYRKEMTGSLDEVQIGDIKKWNAKLQEVDKRRESILASIEEQGKLTPDLRQKIENSYDLHELEDLYLPYKRKRRTRASIAQEKGLEPLAWLILEQKIDDLQNQARAFLNEQVLSVEEALQGARDIIAEYVNEHQEARQKVRFVFEKEAVVRSKVARGKEGEGEKYKDYFDYEEPLKNIPSHRLLAIRRGEEEGFLRVSVVPKDETQAIVGLEKTFLQSRGAVAEQMQLAIADAYQRLLAPSIETEFRNLAKDKADEAAILVFAENLRQLLLASPLGEKRVLAIDPGFRTGCKVVCLDQSGTPLNSTTIFPHPPQSEIQKTIQTLQNLVHTYQIQAIAIGNGTAGRETEALVRAIDFAQQRPNIFLVSENGASIYSASEVAREEFPNYDVTVRGAVSIGRRLMDPLAELVKIDPKSIGVGQYQHDVNQSLLKQSLDTTVESCVNLVGVNLNTASKQLLAYVSGVGDKIAQNIVNFRTENGAFENRQQLKKVSRLGEKAFEQCAGFLRIRNAKNPLDATAVHPESYPIVEQMAKDLKCTVADLIAQKELRQKIQLHRYVTPTVGMPTLQDILKELDKPDLDPRGQAKAFEFTAGIASMDDLHEGMMVNGIITNITNFGAFVDIGIKDSALIHVSQLASRFVRNPAEVVQLHQQVEARVLSIDKNRRRIQLSLIV